MNQSIKKTGNGGKAQTEAIAVQLGAGARKPEGRPSTHTHFHTCSEHTLQQILTSSYSGYTQMLLCHSRDPFHTVELLLKIAKIE